VSPFAREAVSGDTVTATSTAGNTVTTAVPESSAAVSSAVIVTAPEDATAVTRPVDDTVAVAVLEDDHITESVKFTVVVSANVPVAVSCFVSPFASEAVNGDTVTDTSGNTVITAVQGRSDSESLAVIVTTPAALVVTRPVFETVASAVSEDDHVTESVMVCVPPSVKLPVAVSCWVLPASTLAVAGETVIDEYRIAAPAGAATDAKTPEVMATPTRTPPARCNQGR